MKSINQLTQIGKLISTHGIKGEFKIWINNEIQLTSDLINQQIFLQDINKKLDVYTVQKFYELKNKIIIKFEEINSINDAQKLSQNLVFVKTDLNLVEIKLTLLGFTVFENNQEIGKVVDIMNNGLQELIKIANQNESFWVPNVDRYILKIDWNKKNIDSQDLDMLK